MMTDELGNAEFVSFANLARVDFAQAVRLLYRRVSASLCGT